LVTAWRFATFLYAFSLKFFKRGSSPYPPAAGAPPDLIAGATDVGIA
jgi:hypothetical protein